ncbi:site-specific integrase [Microbulbifer sp. 2201CG32-9]|uniref:hypothetical protein n=1 Tax=Microbulbifer sp. 2201CG32-9 TaxID=3232309 RepID=UPI00345BF5D6
MHRKLRNRFQLNNPYLDFWYVHIVINIILILIAEAILRQLSGDSIKVDRLNKFYTINPGARCARLGSVQGHLHDCPYIVSHWPKRKVWNQSKEHIARIMPGRLSNLFAEARDATGLFSNLDEVRPPSFHEVRGLASTLYRIAGYRVEDIQYLMAHENKGTTLDYQDEEALPYTAMDFQLPDDVLGGEF